MISTLNTATCYATCQTRSYKGTRIVTFSRNTAGVARYCLVELFPIPERIGSITCGSHCVLRVSYFQAHLSTLLEAPGDPPGGKSDRGLTHIRVIFRKYRLLDRSEMSRPSLARSYARPSARSAQEKQAEEKQSQEQGKNRKNYKR